MSKKSSSGTKKTSTVRHTRAIQRDRSKRPIVAPPDPVVSARLGELIHPQTFSQVAHYHDLGLRERVLTLPVMVALVLSVIWRQIGSVATLSRLLNDEGFLWTAPVQVSEQALSQRLRVFPAALFQGVLTGLLPTLQERWRGRCRPLPPELAWARAHYPAVLAFDGSTLDALLRKVGLLRDCPETPLAGRMTALLDLCSRLSRQLWCEADAAAHDQRHWPQVLSAVPHGALVVFDLGYTNFRMFAELSAQPITFVTRAKSNLAYHVERVVRKTAVVHEAIVWIGSGQDRQRVRLIEVLVKGSWQRYLTNELDPTVLPTECAVALYWQRWRIEDAVNLVKRLLGLAYLWVGSANGVELQLWATWLLYAVLVDLSATVRKWVLLTLADELGAIVAEYLTKRPIEPLEIRSSPHAPLGPQPRPGWFPPSSDHRRRQASAPSHRADASDGAVSCLPAPLGTHPKPI